MIIVGEFYDVPCVKTEHGFLPVLLPSHQDGNDHCMHNAPEHYHIDFRFITLSETNGIVGYPVLFQNEIHYKKLKAIQDFMQSLEIIGENSFFFINRWYQRYCKLKLKNRACPHKGIMVVNACGTCPAHGLIWNLQNDELKDFELPFFLELANNQIPSYENPRGVIENDSCTIEITSPFNSDGTVILVDATGERYGRMFQNIGPYNFPTGSTLSFATDKICN